MNKRKIIIIGSAIIIALIVIFSIIIISNSNDEDPTSPLDVEIKSDEGTPLINVPFNLWIANCPDGANVTWNMGDGTIKNGDHITHIFTSPYNYNITVNVTKGSQHGFDYDLITARNHPVDVSKTGSIINDIGSSGRREVEITCDVLPGRLAPILDAYVQVKRATGNFEIVIFVDDPNNPDGFNKEYYRQTHTEIRGGIRIDESYYDTPVPPEGSIYRVHVVIIVELGASGEYSMSASLFY